MSDQLTLRDFWNSAPIGKERFDPGRLDDFPEPVRRYLKHSILPDGLMAHSVNLQMHGRIRINKWMPFEAEEVIRFDRGMIWHAKAKMQGLPIRGSDRLIDGNGLMRWKFLGLIPVLDKSGPDVSRSAAGRMAAELVWLPSVLKSDAISWQSEGNKEFSAEVDIAGEKIKLKYEINSSGGLKSVRLSRWGNPPGEEFGYYDFGAIVDEEDRFEDFTIPSELRVGWHFGSDRFEKEGEFLRVKIDQAFYR